jgi:predicted unusual protein kinase regulating ubiquinone biosynthesis (AarF/ABC1/UbiB family)
LAVKNKKLAVKIQYPGVANSISSDLALVKPIAIRTIYKEKILTSILRKLKINRRDQLLIELKQSQEVVAACKKDRKLSFPEYYPEYSSEKLSRWIG